jgi:DNA-directed RNA polymerase subunit RPC12/RpoP
MLIMCSRCGSESVRTSRSRSLSCKVLNLLGIAPFRCQDCDHRFRASIWRIRQMFYAKCPRCHRLDLSKWNVDHYNPPMATRIAVALRAKTVRCEYCRHNFWSFRRVKVVFSLHKRYERSPIVFDNV